MFSLVWNIVYWLVKSHCFQFSGEVENTVFFEPERWWKYDIYILLKSSFGLFGNGKYSLFLRQKVNEKMIFTDYWNVPVLIFLGEGKYSIFEANSWWKNDIHRLLKSSCFELFRDENCGLFWDKKDDIYWLLKSSCVGLPKSYCFELFGDGK